MNADNLQKKTTIHELAERAGVSISTVSRVINSKNYVSPETRNKVEKAIAELNFTPDGYARGLRGVRSNVVALVIPDILNVYYTNLAREIEKDLRKNGYTMLLGVTNDLTALVQDYLEKFSRISIDGIIYTPPPGVEASPFIRSLSQRGIPMVEVNRRRERDLFDGVEADNFGAVLQALDHLYSLNHRKIAFIVGSQSTTTGMQRLEGYRYFMTKNAIDLNSKWIRVGEFSREFGEQATMDILELRGEDQPTAIFPTSNRLLMGTMKILKQQNIRIPDDFSVIAMDDAEWLESFEPSITTVDVAIEEMAHLTVDLLLTRIKSESQPANPRTYTLSTTLKIRNSCRKIGLA